VKKLPKKILKKNTEKNSLKKSRKKVKFSKSEQKKTTSPKNNLLLSKSASMYIVLVWCESAA